MYLVSNPSTIALMDEWASLLAQIRSEVAAGERAVAAGELPAPRAGDPWRGQLNQPPFNVRAFEGAARVPPGRPIPPPRLCPALFVSDD